MFLIFEDFWGGHYLNVFSTVHFPVSSFSSLKTLGISSLLEVYLPVIYRLFFSPLKIAFFSLFI